MLGTNNMQNITEALQLTDTEAINEEIRQREHAIGQMVGTLYPNILRAEIAQLADKRDRYQGHGVDVERRAKILKELGTLRVRETHLRSELTTLEGLCDHKNADGSSALDDDDVMDFLWCSICHKDFDR